MRTSKENTTLSTRAVRLIRPALKSLKTTLATLLLTVTMMRERREVTTLARGTPGTGMGLPNLSWDREQGLIFC